jgi:hypothetical protein
MRKLAILHFNPLELYPPVMNLLRCLAAEPDQDLSVRVYSTRTDEEIPVLKIESARMRILRKGVMRTARGASGRLGLYARYYAAVTWDLFRWRPDTVLVFETLSFLPAYLYTSWLAPGSRLMIHYHEYMSPEDYAQGMKLNKWFHRLERRSYPRTAWVSHTNEERMSRFLRDHAGLRIPHTFIVPNYTPADWVLDHPRPMHDPLRIVYIGSLGLDSMYLKEFTEWVIAQKGKVTWDLYALHVSDEVRSWLTGLDTGLIRFKGSCYYYDLPAILPGYDVGVVLYKGIVPNHVYAVSNKVLEYIACGLDVWYAREMLGTDPYRTPDDVFPRIIPVDFTAMDRFDAERQLDRTNRHYRRSPYLCEEALAPMLEKIKAAD